MELLRLAARVDPHLRQAVADVEAEVRKLEAIVSAARAIASNAHRRNAVIACETCGFDLDKLFDRLDEGNEPRRVGGAR